jgi:hypothetical protein
MESVTISNLNADISIRDLTELCGDIGDVTGVVWTSSKGSEFKTAVVTFDSRNTAYACVKQLHGRTLDGTPMNIRLTSDESQKFSVSENMPGLPDQVLSASRAQTSTDESRKRHYSFGIEGAYEDIDDGTTFAVTMFGDEPEAPPQKPPRGMPFGLPTGPPQGPPRGPPRDPPKKPPRDPDEYRPVPKAGARGPPPRSSAPRAAAPRASAPRASAPRASAPKRKPPAGPAKSMADLDKPLDAPSSRKPVENWTEKKVATFQKYDEDLDAHLATRPRKTE